MSSKNTDFSIHVPGREELLDEYNAGNLSIEELVQKQEELLKARPKLEKTFSELQNIINRGRQNLRIWEQSHEILHGENTELFSLAFRYFTYIGYLLFQSAILQATKLTEKSRESVNLHYLLNLLHHEAKKNFPHNWREIQKSVGKDRTIIDGFHSIIDRLKFKRDKEIAHLDRIVVNSEFESENYVEVQELIGLFETAQTILHKYHDYYFGFAPKKLQLSKKDKTYFGPEGLEDILTLALLALDDNSHQNVSEHVKQVRKWRKARLSVEAESRSAGGGRG